jgi:hypothetical protein
MIVDADLPLAFVENAYFRELLRQFDPELSQTLGKRTTIRSELHKMYEAQRAIVQQELKHAITAIHLSFDLWTSPNRHAIMAIVAHFIDKQKKHQTRLLALRKQQGAHSGSNLATTLVTVTREWDLTGRLSTIVSDNASSNDTCLQVFFSQLDPSMDADDIKHRRIRCYGYILNLAARAFLYGDNFESFEREAWDNNARADDEPDQANAYYWRQRGPIGKLHNIVKFVRASPQRSERFKAISKEAEAEDYKLYETSTAELELIQNNDTRWNSTYLMIKRALQKQADINSFIFSLESDTDEQNTLPAEDRLSHDDWRMLAEIMQLLQPIYFQTTRAQGWGKRGGHGRLWEVMTGIEYLLEHFEDWRSFYDDISTDVAAQRASQAVTRSPSLSPPPAVVLPASQRPSRTRQPPARLSDFEVTTPIKAFRRGRQQRHLQAQRFNETSLPEYIRETYIAAPQEISLRDRLTEHHQATIRQALDNCWGKLNSYYIKLGESPLYAAAVILCPRLGMRYLEANWDQREWIQVAKDSLKEFLERWYHPSTEHEMH